MTTSNNNACSKGLVALASIAFLAFVIGIHSIEAQSAPQIKYKPMPSDSELAELAATAAVADTGRMIPNYREGFLDNYKTPSHCKAMIQRVIRGVWRRADEAAWRRPFTPEDSTPTLAVELGSKCLEKMTPQNVEEMDLYYLMEASAFIGDTAKMRAVVEFYINRDHVSIPTRIEFINMAAMMGHMSSRPVKFQFIADMAEMLKVYGKESLKETVNWMGVADKQALFRFDTLEMKVAAEKRYRYLSQFSDEDLIEAKINGGSLRAIAHGDSVLLTEFRRQGSWKEEMQRLLDIKWEKHPYMMKHNESWLRVIEGVGGQPAELEPVAVYPRGETGLPKKGRVTLYYRPTLGAIGKSVGFHPELVTLKKLYEKYHERGLDVVIVSPINGYMWGSPPLERDKEAPLHAWFLREYLGLPFKLVVNDVKTDKRSDGIILRHRSLWDQFASGGSLGLSGGFNSGYIVGKDGTVQHVSGINPTFEKHFSAVIERELAK